jgi:hypothetical protein
MPGVTTSLSLTFVVMLAIGFALMSLSQTLSTRLEHTMSIMPRTLVQ